MVISIDLKQKRGSAKDKALIPDERTLLIKSLDKSDKIIFILGAYAGLRVGEICQTRLEWLSWKEINFNGFTKALCIKIPAEDKDIRNAYKIWRNKKRTMRTTYIFNLEFASYVQSFFEMGNTISLSRQSINNKLVKWNKYLNRKEKLLTPHALRATATNYMIQELQLPMWFVQGCLGHKDSKTTARHYLSIGQAQQESFLLSGGNK
jgi:integrase